MSTKSTDILAQPNLAEGGQDKSIATKAMIVILVGLVIHAFTAPWVKQANFEPATSAFLRVAIALLVLLPFAMREKGKHGGLNKKGITLSLFAGLFLGIDFMAFNYSIFFVGSGIAMVLLNMQVIILPALAAIFDGYKVSRSYYVLVPIFFLGIALTGGIFEGSSTTEGAATFHGVNIALLGTIAGALSGSCYGVYLYASRKATVVNPGRFIQPMAWSFLAQLVAPTLFMLFVFNRGFDVTHGVLINGKLPLNPETTVGDPITGMNWLWMIILGIAGQAITWTSIQWGSVRLDPTIVAGLLLLSTVATVAIIAPTLFGEIPSPLQIVGVAIVLGAVAFQNKLHIALLKKFRRPKAPA